MVKKEKIQAAIEIVHGSTTARAVTAAFTFNR